jgi:DNA-binding MarR family transcriptional regulator
MSVPPPPVAGPIPRSTSAPLVDSLDPDQSLSDDLRIAISRIARQLRQASDDGFTPTQMSALAVINARGSIKLSELAALERVAAPTITKIIEALVVGGLVERRDDPHDRRACLVQLTVTGKKEMKRVRVERNRRIDHLMAQLDQADQVALIAAIPALVRFSETRP